MFVDENGIEWEEFEDSFWPEEFPFGHNTEGLSKEKKEMLAKRQEATQGAFGGQPFGGNKNGAPKGLPYLKVENLSTERRSLAILMTRAEEDRWRNPSVIMQVRYDGKLYLWQVNDRNPNFNLLIDLLGEDESKWAGGEVLIFLEQDPITQVYWPRVVAAPRPAKKER